MTRTITIVDIPVTELGELAEHADHAYYQRCAATVKNTTPEPVFGTVVVYTKGGLWFYREDGRGGGMRSQGFATREELEADLVRHVQALWNHWDQRAIEYEAQLAGETLRRRGRAPHNYVIADGVVRSLGPESGPSGIRGHAGRKFTFRMLDDGREVVSTNVWFGGEIPAEFLDRMPDNCEIVPEPAPKPFDFGKFS